MRKYSASTVLSPRQYEKEFIVKKKQQNRILILRTQYINSCVSTAEELDHYRYTLPTRMAERKRRFWSSNLTEEKYNYKVAKPEDSSTNKCKGTLVHKNIYARQVGML